MSQGKYELLENECEEWHFEVVGITETNLRETISWEGEKYKFIGKGRSSWEKRGGGVALLISKASRWEVDLLDMGREKENEDILGCKMERSTNGTKEQMILVICYMSTEGPQVCQQENKKKFEMMERVIREYRNVETVVMGDMNAHIGILGERTNRNGEALLKFCEDTSLEILNLTLAEGKVTWRSRGQKSAIDYILVNGKARRKVLRMEVDENKEIEISSDHNFIFIEYARVNATTENEVRENGRVWKLWRANWDNFKRHLNNVPLIEDENVDVLNQYITTKLKETGEKTVGLKVKRKGKKKRRKNWMSNEIKAAIEGRRLLNRERRQLEVRRGRGENVNEGDVREAWQRYEREKVRVQFLIREAMAKDESRQVEIIRNLGEDSTKEWWKFIKFDNTDRDMTPKEIKVGDRIINNQEEIKEEIKIFWEGVGGTHEIPRVNDINLEMTRRVIMGNQTEPFTREEIQKYVSKLKSGKAMGPDGLPNEFFREGGPNLVNLMYVLFRKIFEVDRAPGNWNESRVCLLHKGGYKDKKELKNYRPIAITNAISKVFCGLLNERMTSLVESNNLLSEEQNGFRGDRRGTDNLFILNEVMETYRRKKKKMFCVFLDIEKAYDRIEREVLWEILRRAGFEEKIVNIIKSLYDNTKAKYSLGTLQSDWVESKKGVKQGCILSPLLFALFMDEFIQRVKRVGRGVNINGEKLVVLGFADDVAILVESEEDLQECMDEATRFSTDCNVKFSKEKSQVMIIDGMGGERVVEQHVGRLCDFELKVVTEYKYLGICLQDSGLDKAKNNKICKAEQWYGRLSSIVKFRANDYEIIRGTWKGVGVPAIMYGLEALSGNTAWINKLEKVQNKIARVGLGARRFTAVETLRGEMGWSSFNERIMKSKLKYKRRLECMDEQRWVKKIFNWVGGQGKWNQECRRYDDKIGLNWDQKKTRWGQCRTEEEKKSVERDWVREIENKVREQGCREWRSQLHRKSTLRFYRSKEKPSWENFYDGSWGSKLLFKARSGSLEVNGRVARFTDRDVWCERCSTGGNQIEETIEHLISECDRYEDERAIFMGKLQDLNIELNWAQVREREDSGLGLILGFENNHKEITGLTKEFLTTVWKKRKLEGRAGARHQDHEY